MAAGFRTIPLSLVHTVPVSAPVRHGNLETGANRGESGRNSSAFIYSRSRPGFGQKVITVCPGYATVCDGTFQV